MDNWENGFAFGMQTLGLMCAASLRNEMVKTLVRPDIEKCLNRTLTDWDWEVFLEESRKKANFEAQEKARLALEGQARDRKIIHDFVWGINPDAAG